MAGQGKNNVLPGHEYIHDLFDHESVEQVIILKKDDTGRFQLHHMHKDLSLEIYGFKSIRGVINGVKNLLLALQPELHDIYRKEDRNRPLGYDRNNDID